MENNLKQFVSIRVLSTDLENDKIIIACDDDLKFFIEESACHKLILDFQPSELESSRKRTSSQIEDVTECSKKIRKQLEKIDLSSDESSIDDDNEIYSSSSSKNSSVSNITHEDAMQPEPNSSSSNVKIISVDIIKPADELILIHDENGNNFKNVQAENVQEDSAKQEENVQKSSEQKKRPETNRILISDSSDDEAQDDTANNNRRRFSDGPSSSSYSFAGVGDTFDSRASFDNGRQQRFRRGRHQSRGRNSFQEAAREFQQVHAENMERFHENARAARDQAARAVRASASVIPDILSSFQAHFRRPMFQVSDINQQLFGSFGRH